MTAQVSERLIFEGSEYSMCSEPLGDFFGFGGRRPEFRSPHTACWRGYVGTWEVIDGRLYLTQLKGWLKNGDEATLETVFPGYGERVFAHWFTDTVRLPQGKQLKYVHMGYGSTYERDLLLRFSKGELIERSVRENGTGEPDAPEGYGVAALTTLGNRSGQS